MKNPGKQYPINSEQRKGANSRWCLFCYQENRVRFEQESLSALKKNITSASLYDIYLAYFSPECSNEGVNIIRNEYSVLN
jgi:hypothetical protein